MNDKLITPSALNQDDSLGLRSFTVVIDAGKSESFPSSLDGFRITSLTNGATLKGRLETGDECALFNGFGWRRKEYARRPRGITFRNAGGASLTVSGFIWVGGEVTDDRTVIDSTTALSATIIGPLKSIDDTPDIVAAPVAVFSEAIPFGTSAYDYEHGQWTAGTLNVVLAAANTAGILVTHAFASCEAYPNRYAHIKRGTQYIIAVKEGGFDRLPAPIRIPSGISLTLEYSGPGRMYLAYKTL